MLFLGDEATGAAVGDWICPAVHTGDMAAKQIRHGLVSVELVDDSCRYVHRYTIAMFATIVKGVVATLATDGNLESRQNEGMQERDVNWLKAQIKTEPHGFQADLARAVGLTPDKLSKILKGRRKLEHSEGVALEQAIQTLKNRAPRPLEQSELPAPEGSAVIDRIIGRRPEEGRPAELVFLLKDRNYLDFQLDSRLLEQLRLALREMMGS